MHHIYRTKAIVLKNRESGEADHDFVFLTERFGLVFGRAQGVRKMHSKLRHALQVYSVVDLALVRGRAGFRVTNARLLKNFFYEKRDYTLTKIISKISNLLERLIQGEDFEPRIFQIVLEAIEFYSANQNADKNFLKKIETLTVAKILYLLGYFRLTDDNQEILMQDISLNNLNQLDHSDLMKTFIKEINSAIKESQL